MQPNAVVTQTPPATPDSKLLAFRADSELVKALEEAARKNDRSVSGEIRQALREYLARKEAA